VPPCTSAEDDGLGQTGKTHPPVSSNRIPLYLIGDLSDNIAVFLRRFQWNRYDQVNIGTFLSKPRRSSE
jgi:hypothetical protein